MNNETTKLFAQLDAAIAECIVIPNEWLPEAIHDNTRGGRTLARLEQICDERDGMTAHKKRKATKAENIANYRKQFEENGEFEYNGHVDEIALYNNQVAMVKGMVNGGLIDEDDFEL
jgi:hypothetical protein